MLNNPNIHILSLAAHELGDLADEVVFVGGATVGLYITDNAVPEIRSTLDVDCVVEVSGKTNFYQTQERLGLKGFSEAINGPICRWEKGDLILDVMPTDKNILGFSNQWYSEGVSNSIKTILPSKQEISIFSVAYFLASKIEAFKGRGNNDYIMSNELEDIIVILDGNENIVEHISDSQPSVKESLKNEFGKLLKTSDFLEFLEGHISDRQNTHSRAQIVINRIRKISELQ